MEKAERSKSSQRDSTISPLQSEIPLPSLLPKGWNIDLNYFFTIPFKEDREKFSFIVPSYDSQPSER